ncbi:hypothetical protein HQ496_04055 [bacterium]|nr:hypothetical protein [bacterium]
MASTTPDRSHKLVMGLGIVAILLFSANLITAIVHHLWPEQESRVLHFTSESWGATDATAEVYTIGRANGLQKFVIRHRHAAPEIVLSVETDLDQEIAELERRIEIEASVWSNELALKLEKNEWHETMQSAKETLQEAERSLAREKAVREVEVSSRDGRNR